MKEKTIASYDTQVNINMKTVKEIVLKTTKTDRKDNLRPIKLQ